MNKITVENMTSNNGNKIANQFLIQADDGLYFQSYNSMIAHKALDGTVTLGEDWNYSVTTGKYRNIFLNEKLAETQKKLDSGIYKFNPNL
jgi:hypothetical protein